MTTRRHFLGLTTLGALTGLVLPGFFGRPRLAARKAAAPSAVASNAELKRYITAAAFAQADPGPER